MVVSVQSHFPTQQGLLPPTLTHAEETALVHRPELENHSLTMREGGGGWHGLEILANAA